VQQDTGNNISTLFGEEPVLTTVRQTHAVKNRLLKVDNNRMVPERIN
jgi:hypothetical protein